MKAVKFIHLRRKKEYVTDILFTQNTGTIITNKNELYLDAVDLKDILEHEGGDIRGRDITYNKETCCINIGRSHKFRRNEKSCKEGVKGFISR